MIYMIFIFYILCIVLLLLLLMYNNESFTSNAKAKRIVDWFNEPGDKSYQQYKRDLDGLSDIVEYDSISSVYKKNNGITVEDVSSLI